MENEAQKIQAEITAKKKQLEKLQKECEHKSQVIKMDEKNSAMWECTQCSLRLRYPTPGEIQKWMHKK